MEISLENLYVVMGVKGLILCLEKSPNNAMVSAL